MHPQPKTPLEAHRASGIGHRASDLAASASLRPRRLQERALFRFGIALITFGGRRLSAPRQGGFSYGYAADLHTAHLTAPRDLEESKPPIWRICPAPGLRPARRLATSTLRGYRPGQSNRDRPPGGQKSGRRGGRKGVQDFLKFLNHFKVLSTFTYRAFPSLSSDFSAGSSFVAHRSTCNRASVEVASVVANRFFPR